MIQKLRKGQIMGVGIGIPGQIDSKKGVVLGVPNLPGWGNVALKRIIEERLRIPIFIENDANCFALAESKCGQGRKIENLLCMTLGSGVGGGIILNGKLYTGSGGFGGELGHITIDRNEEMKCNSGHRGCLEVYSCARGIERRYKIATKKKAETKEICEMARSKSAPKKVKQIVQEAGECLGIALANHVNVFNPDLIIIGGGVSKSKTIVDTAIRTMKKYALPQPAKKVKVIVSKLQDAGIIGAASIIHR